HAPQPPRNPWSPAFGLFDDTPDKLLRDVEKARAKRDEEESVRVLVEGRKLLERNDLDGAARAAHRAETLHGPYDIFDLGDRPNKLLADVQAARERQRHTPLPPPPGAPGAVARNDTPPRPPVGPNGGPPSPPPPGAPDA